MTHQELSPAQAAEWIDEQIRKGGSVFCPFCHGLNQPGQEDNPCCRAFALAIQDRADAMTKSFASQYTAVEVGLASSITCPWCKTVNRTPGPVHRADWIRPNVSPFCCHLFELALA